jgi:hypothetical protein
MIELRRQEITLDATLAAGDKGKDKEKIIGLYAITTKASVPWC